MGFTFKLKRFLNGNDKKGMFKYLNWISCEEGLFLASLFQSSSLSNYVKSQILDFDVLKKVTF